MIRSAGPNDGTESAAYLATPFARRLTGTTTYVDGGLSIMA